MNNVFGLNFFVFCLVILVITLFLSMKFRNEGFDNTGALINLMSTESFGMAPGVIDQMSSTRVLSNREQAIDDKIYDNLTRQGLINMTESGYKESDFAKA